MAERAKRRPKPTVTLTSESYVVYCCGDGHVHVDVLRGSDEPVQLTFEDPEGAYDYAQAILRAYDLINGIDG